MNRNLYYLLSFTSLLFITCSCTTPRYIYSPSAQNVPVLTKKGDSKLGGVYSTNFVGEEKRDGKVIDNRSRGYDLHAAVAITDNFAVQAGHFYRWAAALIAATSLRRSLVQSVGTALISPTPPASSPPPSPASRTLRAALSQAWAAGSGRNICSAGFRSQVAGCLPNG